VEIYTMDLYLKVRLACAGGMSQREAAKHFNISRETVRKMLSYSEPPGYRRTAAVRRPKLEAFVLIIDARLDGDRQVPRKQRHTAKRVFDRLREEHSFTGGYTIIKDYIRDREQRCREMFVPLAHAPGHAQADFGEAMVEIGGVVRQGAFFRARSAAQRRLLRARLSRCRFRGMDGRPCSRLRVFRRGAALDRLR
jgi:transposase